MSQEDNVGGSDAPKFMRNVSDQELVSLTSAQNEFVVSMRSLDPDLGGSQLKEMVAELFPPASLFAKEICDLPSVWVELPSYLNAKGAGLQPYSSRRVIMTLDHGIYDDADNRDAATQMARLIVSSGRKVRTDLQETAPMIIEITESGSESGKKGGRLAHDIAMRLKDADKKFSGDLGECWMDFVDEYSQVALDYGLNAQHKLQNTSITYCPGMQSVSTLQRLRPKPKLSSRQLI